MSTVHLVDSSVWIALSIAEHDHNAAATAWLDSISEPDSISFCRATQQSVLRLLTTRVVLAAYGYAPLSNAEAWQTYLAFSADVRVVFRNQEPQGIEARWREYSDRNSASPKVWMDAYLAAFAVTGGYQLVTTDTAFTQFAGLDLLLLGA
ncbi:MAG: TA system VapC family ribonuclease toxin [Thermomicrobiales bacterium]